MKMRMGMNGERREKRSNGTKAKERTGAKE
jgi:hypothetical protein